MEASRSRSPIWTVSPPRSAGSIAVRRSTVDPAIASTRVRIAAVSSLVSGAARGDRGHHDPAMRVELALELLAHARQVADPATLDEQAHEPQRARTDPGLEQRRDHPEALGQRDGGTVDDGRDLGPGEHVGGQHEVVAPAIELAVAQGDLEGRLRVPAAGRGRSCHQPADPPAAGSARKSATSLRWRSPVIDSPTTRPAAARARSVTSPRSSATARWRSASISVRRALAQPGDLVAGRGDVLLPSLGRDLLGAGEDLVGLAAGLGDRGLSLLLGGLAVAARLLGVLEALLDPRLAVARGS